MSRKASQLIGQRFGKLLVLTEVEFRSDADEHVFWRCQCDCGNTTVSSSANLLREKRGTKQCKECGYIPRTPAWKQVFELYKRNAVRNQREFDFSEQEFRHMISESCSYCGKPPTQKFWKLGRENSNHREFVYNGLDRIDSSKGYTEENVVPCCKTCNELKSDKSREEFLAAIEAIHNFQSCSKFKVVGV